MINHPIYTHEMDTVAVVGAGSWGTTLAMLATAAGRHVTLLAHHPDLATYMINHRRHPTSLPDVTIPETLQITSDAVSTLSRADVVVLAVPTQKLRQATRELLEIGLGGQPIICVAKGLEIGSQMRPSQVVATEVGEEHTVAVLSGPNLALEIAQGRPATAVMAHGDLAVATQLAAVFHSQRFRIYHGQDVVGVEIGGALKNIIAIGAGIADGMAAGDNAKAAFMTRGIAEIARIGTALGAQPLTFAGLTGIGDLIATCASQLSRNHRVGRELATGRSLDDIIAGMSEVAEGVPTTKAAFQLGRSLQIDTPIVDEMHAVLFEGARVSDAVARLMDRERTVEHPR